MEYCAAEIKLAGKNRDGAERGMGLGAGWQGPCRVSCIIGGMGCLVVYGRSRCVSLSCSERQFLLGWL